MATYTPADNMQAMASVHMAKFRTWLGPTLKGFLGEFGVPNDRGASEQAQWNAMQNFLLTRAAADNIAWTFWATGHLWGTGYNVSYYEKNGSTWAVEDSASTMETHYNDPVPFTGGNYAGHEFFNGSTPPTNTDLIYHYNRGMRKMRYPVSPAYLYPTANGSLNAANLTHIQNMLNAAEAAGIDVILDILHPGSGGDYAKMFGTTIDNTAARNLYKDYITKVFNANITRNSQTIQLRNHPALWAFDMANEPAHINTITWQTVSQDIYNYIRNTIGWSGRIMVPVGAYSGVHSISSYHPGGPWITPVSGDTNYYYEAHFYPNLIGQFGVYDGTFNNPNGTQASYASNLAQAGSYSGQGSFTYTPGSSSIDVESWRSARLTGRAGVAVASTRSAILTGETAPSTNSSRTAITRGYLTTNGVRTVKLAGGDGWYRERFDNTTKKSSNTTANWPGDGSVRMP